MNTTTTVYRIDAQDILCDIRVLPVGTSFDPESAVDFSRYLGKSMQTYIANEEIRLIYQRLLEKVRRCQESLAWNWRCDDATRRRDMRMTLVPLPGDGVQVISDVIAVEDRPAIALLDDDAPRTQSTISICSWCNRTEIADGEWLELQDAVAQLAILEAPVPKLNHVICADCHVRLHALYKE